MAALVVVGGIGEGLGLAAALARRGSSARVARSGAPSGRLLPGLLGAAGWIGGALYVNTATNQTRDGVEVAAFASWHELHDAAVGVLEAGAQLPAHAAFETYSVLTRLPQPARAEPADVVRFLRSWFDVPYPSLGTRELADLVHDLPARRVAGGATYDALIAAVAAALHLPLVTCDRRALATYRRFDVTVELLA